MTYPIYPPPPGSPTSHCVEECAHIPCRIQRAVALRLCRYCGKPLGYGRHVGEDADSRFYHIRCRLALDESYVRTHHPGLWTAFRNQDPGVGGRQWTALDPYKRIEYPHDEGEEQLRQISAEIEEQRLAYVAARNATAKASRAKAKKQTALAAELAHLKALEGEYSADVVALNLDVSLWERMTRKWLIEEVALQDLKIRELQAQVTQLTAASDSDTGANQ